MDNKITYTSSLPKESLLLLTEYSKKLGIPKSQLINLAITNYITGLRKEEYIKSFQMAKMDAEIKELTESGFEDYMDIISK